MTTGIVFVHGINTGPHERAELLEKMQARMGKFWISGTARHGPMNPPPMSVAAWRSSGDFLRDLVELVGLRWEEAVADVKTAIVEAGNVHDKLLVIAHSMGQPLSVEALAGMYSVHNQTTKISLLTVGGPMGCSWYRPYLDRHMPGSRWGRGVGTRIWWDCFNQDDPVCGGPMYNAFLAAKPIKMDVPGHPGIFNPLAEHSSYFGQQHFWDIVATMVADLEAA